MNLRRFVFGESFSFTIATKYLIYLLNKFLARILIIEITMLTNVI
ncbi:hypothetical protein ZOD2009_00355 [Haladaptatus paucihalophilus DX253]|uniref:Uncharacterized protein n=1 Tax=Haladaptatus paucihalophilus DX253 TaxID=797209 RepID=E7QMQ3_HALPU|nr:hypothetical protein ZOD2009_00355 [Haladaptatus paucihalophilus DX253]SHL34685.1 hypothetical protein SAMN05444342_3601 [Haladaptatus paucihalophilus DX253]